MGIKKLEEQSLGSIYNDDHYVSDGWLELICRDWPIGLIVKAIRQPNPECPEDVKFLAMRNRSTLVKIGRASCRERVCQYV